MALVVLELVRKMPDLGYSGYMKNVCEAFAGKKITVMGLGLLGRGVGDVAFLAECGAQVLVTDKKTEEELASSVEALKKYPNVAFRLGGHDEADFTSCDMVFKAAGVPLTSPYIAAARAAGIPVYMSTALFAKSAMGAGATVIGITGTRGKSTTTQMIYQALKAARDASTVHLGGNIRGVSTLALLPEIKPQDIVVLELDSWQLQGFGDLQISPNIAIFTNLMPDHQNYYSDMDQYFSDKANIFRHQKEGDHLFVGSDIANMIRTHTPPIEPIVPEPLPADWALRVPGEHNRENAALARSTLSLFMQDLQIRTTLAGFSAVEGRLQLAGEKGGIKIYNDNNATTPDATIAALKALCKDGKNIILVMGGADKGLDMSRLLYEIARCCKRVIALSGTGTSRVAPLMQDLSVYDSLETAMAEALRSAQSGDIILFSPAFASFGMFKNEYERNDRLMSIVTAW